MKGGETKPWKAFIKVTEDGKPRLIHIGYFTREDAPRAYDRVNMKDDGGGEGREDEDEDVRVWGVGLLDHLRPQLRLGLPVEPQVLEALHDQVVLDEDHGVGHLGEQQHRW